MNVLKWKIFLSNNLPTWAFRLLARAYRVGSLALARIPFFRASRTALALRIPRRQLSKADRARLARLGDPELQQWEEAFAAYDATSTERVVDLGWTHKPVGGNFGDWLAPYIVRGAVGCGIRHVDLTDARTSRHVVSLGSIISRANDRSVVIGSGINSLKDTIDPGASFRMVRGYITREALPPSARSADMPCCDPGFFMRQLYRPRINKAASARLLIPHINHHGLFSPMDCDEFELLSARMCRPADIEGLIDRIASAQEVVTSAMHIFVMCCTFGVRCALVKPLAADVGVPGDGVKYRDCMTPVLGDDFSPFMLDIRAGARLSENVETKVYDIDFGHIGKSFEAFKAILEET